jgi:hypothetical protein
MYNSIDSYLPEQIKQQKKDCCRKLKNEKYFPSELIFSKSDSDSLAYSLICQTPGFANSGQRMNLAFHSSGTWKFEVDARCLYTPHLATFMAYNVTAWCRP